MTIWQDIPIGTISMNITGVTIWFLVVFKVSSTRRNMPRTHGRALTVPGGGFTTNIMLKIGSNCFPNFYLSTRRWMQLSDINREISFLSAVDSGLLRNSQLGTVQKYSSVEHLSTNGTRVASPHCKAQEPSRKRGWKDCRGQRSGRTRADSVSGQDRTTAFLNWKHLWLPVGDSHKISTQ